MTFLHNLVRDLVERKLWPLVVLLVAGLVAVPVVLGGGESETASTPPAVTPATPAPAKPKTELAEVTLDDSAPDRRDRGGKVRDPFHKPASARAADAAASAGSSAPSGASSVADTTAGGSSAGGAIGATGTSDVSGAIGGSSSGADTGVTSGGGSGSTDRKSTRLNSSHIL